MLSCALDWQLMDKYSIRMWASTNANTVTAKYPFLLNALPIAVVLALCSCASCAFAWGATVSKTTLSTAATTFGTAGEIFLNSSANFCSDASDVGKKMLPERSTLQGKLLFNVLLLFAHLPAPC